MADNDEQVLPIPNLALQQHLFELIRPGSSNAVKESARNALLKGIEEDEMAPYYASIIDSPEPQISKALKRDDNLLQKLKAKNDETLELMEKQLKVNEENEGETEVNQVLRQKALASNFAQTRERRASIQFGVVVRRMIMTSYCHTKPKKANMAIEQGGQLKAAEDAIKAGNNAEGERILKQILEVKNNNGTSTEGSSSADEDNLRQRELALTRLGQLYRDEKDANKLAEAVRSSRALMASIAKAKTAKLIRTLIDYFGDIPNSSDTQIAVTKENIEWARGEKRVFLRQNLETRLIGLYFETRAYREALPLIDSLLKELKRLDDKMILTEVHLLESRVNHAISNFPKAKASLTSARTAANAIYCPPLLQAQLDMQSGVLHAEDKDYTTAYSYFFETLEGLASQDDARAPLALKYMLLCKIMLNLPDDINAIIEGKLAQRYAGRDIEAMKAVAKAHEDRSLEQFEKALKEYKGELSNDAIIRNHLAALYDTLLEQNLLRIIEPYSRVEMSYVAKQVRQPVREVEQKLSQMILDKNLHGILDQGNGCLVVFDEPEEEKMYEDTLDTIKHVSNVVDSLAAKAKRLS